MRAKKQADLQDVSSIPTSEWTTENPGSTRDIKDNTLDKVQSQRVETGGIRDHCPLVFFWLFPVSPVSPVVHSMVWMGDECQKKLGG
jgi:hypothetical protein